MSKSREWVIAMQCFDGTNTTNIWRVSFSKFHFYMVSKPGKQVQYPANVSCAWCEEVRQSEKGILRLIHLAIEAGLLVIPEQLARETNKENAVDQQHNLLDAVATAAAMMTCPPPSLIYWYSTEERNLFGAQQDDETALQALQRKILKLRAGNETADGYKMLIEGGDPHNACTDHQVYEIRQRCAILCAAYVFAEEQMYNGTTWKSCCRQSCTHLNMCGIKQTTNWKVLERWNIAFHSKECFNHPNPHVSLGKVHEPLLFEAFPWIKHHICNFVFVILPI